RCLAFGPAPPGRSPGFPGDASHGAGPGTNALTAFPSLTLIVVRTGEGLVPEPKDARDVFEAFHDQRVKLLFEPVLDAITDRPKSSSPQPLSPRAKGSGAAPYPASKVITGLAWVPRESIVRKARGSDNWPLTWADDDHQYTA